MQMVVNIEYSRLIDVTAKICDEYCKWPVNTEDQEQLDRFCAECPLNNILAEKKEEDEDEEYPLGRNDWQE